MNTSVTKNRYTRTYLDGLGRTVRVETGTVVGYTVQGVTEGGLFS